MGHNMGSVHDRANTSGGGAYPYSYGYQYIKNPGNADPSNFSTIMAYDNCDEGCPTIGYFSNPAVTYNGIATGVPITSGLAADNALSLNNTRGFVAGFRATPGNCTFTFDPTTFTLPPAAGRTPAQWTVLLVPAGGGSSGRHRGR
jgi:hypothetical protein